MNSLDSKKRSKIYRQQSIRSEPEWKKENSHLHGMLDHNYKLKEQIEKESFADESLQRSIFQRVAELKEKAVGYTSVLEKEKRKNVQLEAIIRHLNYIMKESHYQEAMHRDDTNFDSLDNLEKKIKKMEIQMERICSKNNQLNSKIQEKKNEVNSSRTHRVINSVLFVNLENQIVSSELNYKQLLIEKIKLQKSYNEKLYSYYKIKDSLYPQKESSSVNNEVKKKEKNYETSERQFFNGAPIANEGVKFTEILHSQNKKKTKLVVSTHKNSFSDESTEKNQIRLKKLYSQTGLTEVQDLLFFSKEIDRINSQLFGQLNGLCEKISDKNKEVKEKRQLKQKRTVKHFDVEKKMTESEKAAQRNKDFMERIDNKQNQEQSVIRQIKQFKGSRNLSQLHSLFGTQKDEEMSNFEDFQQNFVEVAEKIDVLIERIKQFNFENEMKNNNQLKSAQGTNQNDNYEDLMNRVKKVEGCDKIMTQQEFKKQYEQEKRCPKNMKSARKMKSLKIRSLR